MPLPLSPAIIIVGGACTLADAITAANSDTAIGGCSAGFGADRVSLTADVLLTTPDNGKNGLPQISTDILVDGNGHTVARDQAPPSSARARLFRLRPDRLDRYRQRRLA